MTTRTVLLPAREDGTWLPTDGRSTINYHGRQSYDKANEAAGNVCRNEAFWKALVTGCESKWKGQERAGEQPGFYARGLMALNLAVLTAREGRCRSTLFAYNCTMEVEQERFRKRIMFAQGNICTRQCLPARYTVRLGIRRCSSPVSLSSLEQLFMQSKDDVKEEIFR